MTDWLNYDPERTGRRENLLWVMKYMPVPKTQAGLQMAYRILVFFIPMIFCFFFAGRLPRMGLSR